MGQEVRAWRPGAAGAVAVAVLLAGCGSAHLVAAGSGSTLSGQHSTGTSSTGTSSTGTSSSTGPPGGTPAQARKLARKLLPTVILPPGSKALRGPVPPPLRGPGVGLGSRQTVDVHRQFSLRLSQAAAARFFHQHVPAGMRFGDNGSTSGQNGLESRDLAYVSRSLPAGIYQAEIDLTVVPAPVGGGSLVRADAQVIWLPPRTAAEYVDPAHFASVVLTADEAYEKERTVTGRFTSRTVITALAGLLNSRPASPDLALPCPMAPVSYRVGFAVTAHGRPSVVAATGSCFIIEISVAGRGQPSLADPNGTFAAYLQHLLGIRQ